MEVLGELWDETGTLILILLFSEEFSHVYRCLDRVLSDSLPLFLNLRSSGLISTGAFFSLIMNFYK